MTTKALFVRLEAKPGKENEVAKFLRDGQGLVAQEPASTYLVETNKSGNQKGDLSYLAGTKKRSDSLIEVGEGARAVGRQ